MNKEETINSYMADIDSACDAYGVKLPTEVRRRIELSLELTFIAGEGQVTFDIQNLIRSEVTIQN